MDCLRGFAGHGVDAGFFIAQAAPRQLGLDFITRWVRPPIHCVQYVATALDEAGMQLLLHHQRRAHAVASVRHAGKHE